MDTPNSRYEALQGLVIAGCLLILVALVDPVLLWFSYSQAGTFWGFYAGWSFIVMLFFTVLAGWKLLRDEGAMKGR